MPVTPFHMGPGLVLKSVLADRFSLITFGVAQVAIDLQPLFVLVTGYGSLHGITHTPVGAAVIGILVPLVARSLCPWLLGLWRSGFDGPEWLREFPDPGWGVVFGSALLGTWSLCSLTASRMWTWHRGGPSPGAGCCLAL